MIGTQAVAQGVEFHKRQGLTPLYGSAATDNFGADPTRPRTRAVATAKCSSSLCVSISFSFTLLPKFIALVMSGPAIFVCFQERRSTRRHSPASRKHAEFPRQSDRRRVRDEMRRVVMRRSHKSSMMGVILETLGAAVRPWTTARLNGPMSRMMSASPFWIERTTGETLDSAQGNRKAPPTARRRGGEVPEDRDPRRGRRRAKLHQQRPSATSCPLRPATTSAKRKTRIEAEEESCWRELKTAHM